VELWEDLDGFWRHITFHSLGHLCMRKENLQDKLCFSRKLFYLHLGSCDRSFETLNSLPCATLATGSQLNQPGPGQGWLRLRRRFPDSQIGDPLRQSIFLISSPFNTNSAQLFHFCSSSREILYTIHSLSQECASKGLSISHQPLGSSYYLPPNTNSTTPQKYPP